MRQFRGFTKESVEAKGGYCTVEGKHFIIPDDAELCNTTPDAKFMDGICGMVEVLPETVGQSTGLHDKNGKENFHKDILDWDGNRFVIDWDNASGQWYGQPMAGNKERGILSGCAFCKTLNIGNIHTSPELPEAKR